jgi:uncharacterized membrane protein
MEWWVMRARRPQLTLGVAALLTVVALSLLPDSNVVARAIVALPMVLVLPGYALVSATFADDTLGTTERIALSLGLSLLLTVVGGVVVDATPWGLRAGSWIVLLGGITLVACFVTLALPRRASDDRREGATVAARESRSVPRAPTIWQVRDLTLFALAGAITIAAGWAAVAGAQVPREGFSQLWMLPADDSRDVVRVGVRSEELEATEFTLRLVADNTTLLRSDRVRLAPGDQWETTVALATPAPTSQVEALLYRADGSDQPYRRVLLRTAEPSAQAQTSTNGQ